MRTHNSEPDRPAGATDLDSKDFNVDKYVSDLLRNTRLNQLLSSSTGMSSDIKSLDADMQRLVYENYNRFITATDTIRDLKVKIDAASPTMTNLEQTSEEIERCRNAVRSKLQQRQQQVSDLNDVQALLLKLESVFELPQRLRVAIDAGAFVVAVDSVIAARPVLNRAGYKGTLRRVAAEVEVLVKEIDATLKAKVVAHSPAAVECIGLIRRLGGPVADLQDEFVKCMKAAVTKGLTSAQQALSAALGSNAEAESDGRDPEAVYHILHELQQTFFPELISNSRLFAELFDAAGRPSLIRVCRDLLASYQALVKQVLESLATSSATSSAAQAVSHGPDGSCSPSEGDWGVQRVVAALGLVTGDLLHLHPLLPELSLQDRAAETTQKCVRHHVAACITALATALWEYLSDSVGKVQPVQLQQQLGDALMAAMAHQLQSLHQYAVYPEAAASWHDGFVDLLQSSVQKLLLLLMHRFMVAAGATLQEAGVPIAMDPTAAVTSIASNFTSRADHSSDTQLLLAVAAFSARVRDDAVPRAVALVAATLRGAPAATASFDAPLVSKTGDNAFKCLVSKYTEVHAVPMIAAVREGVRGGPSDPEPTACRPFCAVWARCLASASQELMALQEDHHMSGNRMRLASDHLGVAALSASVAHQSPLTTAIVLPGIIAPALGALVETLRLQTLSCGALHQVQADAHVLKSIFMRNVATYAAVSILSTLDHAVITAAERCLNPVLLTAAAIKKIAVQSGPPQ